MTNPFLLSEIEKPQQPKQADVNPYSMQSIESDQRQDLRNTLTGAVRQQPEQVAEAARLAKRYPAPVDVLARNLQDVKLQEAVDKYDETLKTSPKLQQYILDKPWETARLHKDIPQLSALEQTFNVVRSVPAGAVRGLGSVASGAGELYNIVARQLAKPIIAIGGDAARDFLNTPIPQLLDPSATLLKRPGQSLKSIADVIGVDPANRNFATDVGEGIGQLIQQIGVQIATGGTASLVTLFSQGADTMATKTAKDAASQDAKDAAVLTGASITALTEKYGVDKLLNRVPPKIKNDALRWVADKLAAGGIEATQEIVEGVLQDVVRVVLTNADAEIGDGALYEGGVAATSAAIVRAALGVRVRSNEQIERYDRAVEASNNLRQQLQAVQDIQARAHSPEVFREVVQGMADQTEGAPKSLWVDGEVLAQLPAEELATLPAEVQEQIADAAASSGFVEIPIGDIMLAEQGSVLEQTYVEYARETPDSPTLAEAQEAKALMESTLMQDAEGAIAQAQEQDAVRASSEVVRKAVLEQLNTAGKTARQYRPSVNDALARVTAALFTTQAQRMNMTPEQMFAMSGFAVRGAGQQQGKGRVLNADGGTLADVTAQWDAAGIRNSVSEKNGVITLERIVVPEGQRSQGAGTQAMQALVEYADATGQRIELGASSQLGGDKARLVEFYERFGFARKPRSAPVSKPFKDTAMAREPQQVLNQAAVERLTSAAERGERITGTRAVISPEEKQAIKDSAEKVGISEKEITRVVREHKLAHPPAQGWAPLVFNRVVLDDGKVTYEYQKTPYDFSADKDGKQLEPGSPEYKRRVNAVARGMTDEVRRVFVRANAGDKNAQNILAQAGWYKSMRSRLRQEFGGLGDLFADLLGATSPNTPVRDNWTNAVDSLRRASRGDFDALFPQWEAWSDNVDNLENTFRAWFNERVAEGLTKKAIKGLPEYKTQLDALKEARKLPDNLLPTKESGKKYGFNGRNVARAMVDLWRVVKNADPDIARGGTAPKALNFSGNLIGFRERATIDVWAARMLQRLGGGQRIASMAETGVSGEMREDATTTLQFGFGQDVFTEAVKRIRTDQELKTNKTLANINDDDLQAVVWFVEKELWTVNNWTNAAGEGGSFELEANLSGLADQARIKELRRILDSSKSKPDAKAQAREELAALERTVDRFVGGLSIQMSADTQGLDFVPTDADMARLAERVRTAVYEADDGNTVLASKTLSTQGRYGAPERALDLEVVAREGYNPNALWLEMLRQAQAAKQDSTFLSRVLRDNEDYDPAVHRPGVEIYFREAAAQEQLEQVLADLAKEGVEFLTVIVDGRRMSAGTAGEMPPAVGVRLQYVPEFEQRYGMDDFSQLDDLAIAAKMEQKAAELRSVAERVSGAVEGVSFAGQFWYETQTAFSTEYQEKIDALTIGSAEEGAAGVGGPQWSGQSVRQGVESADRQTREASGGQPDADLLGGDALSPTDGQQPDTLNQEPLAQGPRGTYNPRNFEIVLNENANLSTYFHELSHFYLDFLGRMSEMPNASPEVVEDFNTFLKWANVTPEQWREWRDFVIANPNKPLPKGMVKVHEALARAGEQYFLEGKAPSVELQPFMRRFARWMESVYTSLVNFIAGNPDKGLQLNADIRRFFDRALATDEQIAQAEQAAGMTPDDDATAEAKERLNKRSMAGFKWSVQMRDKIIADLRKQAKEIEDSIRQRVTEEVDEMPAMQARAALAQLMAASPEYKADLKAWDEARAAELARATEAVKEQLVAAEVARTNAPLEGLAKGRFLSQNRAEVENKAEAAALTWEKSNPKPRRITPDMTPQMESIAEKYGYSSVDQMLQDIDAVGSRREMIDGLTEQRMLEEHGDLIDDRAIQQAANEAVHNDARARALAAELRTQQEMMGERTDTGRVNTKGRRITVNTLLAAARNFAANVVGRAKVMDLGNLSWKHNAAEARAGKRWQQLTAEGKTVEAVKAKQDQVIHNAAAKAALEAQAEIQKLLTYLKKFDKDSVRTKLPASYLDQIDKLLERVDLRVSTTRRDIDKRAALSKWIESQHALGLDPIVPDYLLDDAQLTSYKEMTVDQFRELTDTIKNIEHFGRLKSRLLAAKDKREFDAIATEIANEIITNKGTPLQVQLEPDGRTKKFFKGAWADHRKLNSLVRQMDGGKDNGPFYRALVRSMNEAGTKENVMLEQATEALAKIYAPIEALPGGFSGASVYIPAIGASLSRAGRLAVALNWGNSTNRQRVMGGDNWTEAQVDAILATLSTTELEFVNNVWAQLDSYWPEMKAKQERVNGVVEDKVEAEPFELTAADGTVVQMRGGYYPIKYDSDRSLKSQKNEAQEVAADMLRGAILRPSTRRGHLKAREEEVNRPVRKDLSVITQHVNQVVHDLAWHEWLIDATRLLNDPRIAGAIRDYHGPEIHRAMTEAMRAIAEGDIAHQTEIDKLLLLMRANVTRSIMGASLTTALLQPFGLTQSMARIGVVPVLKGAWRWAGDGAQMQNSMKWIGEKSDFMRLRSKTFNRELREISQRVQGKSKFMQVADASLFFLMQKLQMVADVPTWIGAYEKALAGGVDEATAVQLADEAVLSSQGGGNTKDLAGVQRNLPFLTQFYSYFSTTLNLVAEKTALTDFKNPRAVAGWLGDMALLAVVPAILPALITYLLKGGGEDDEPEDWAKRLAEWQASYLLGMFVGLRELPAIWSPFDYQGPPAGKLINDGKRLVQQVGQGEIDDPAVLATIGFLGTALGIPTTQIIRSYKGWLAWDEGDAPPTSILFGPPPKD